MKKYPYPVTNQLHTVESFNITRAENNKKVPMAFSAFLSMCVI